MKRCLQIYIFLDLYLLRAFFFFFQCHNHEEISILQVLHSNMELNSHKINSLFSNQLMVTGSAQQHRFVITFMKDKLVRMLS
jgi:hypothetical protein